MNTSSLWQSAAAFAARAHVGQLRKDGKTPYFSHPCRVTLTVACVFGCTDAPTLAAALLHDVIEDCGVDYNEVAEAFGSDVADIVVALTKDMRLPEAKREPAYDAQLAAGPWQARLIKLADVHDNFSDATSDKARAKVREKADRAIALAGDDPRLAKAVDAVRRLIA
ncbi:MAG TPA: HD domain-containing protein [Phycisphaerales bacterium]|nr:HD domain-containing protein [Phycisphaerales bacterium]HRQ75689.1 HD domain-containing protein [Phycisphaerales bacterium]